MPPMPDDAEPPPDLVTPLTARPAASASQARRSSSEVEGTFGIQEIEVGKFFRQQRRIGEADIFIIGRNPRHRHRAFGQFGDAIATDIVGGYHRLALSHQHPQSDIVAFGSFGFFDASVAHLDALRHAAHRDRVGGIRAGALGGLDQPLRQRAQRRLIEQVGSCGIG